jgi:hypothetical protein
MHTRAHVHLDEPLRVDQESAALSLHELGTLETSLLPTVALEQLTGNTTIDYWRPRELGNRSTRMRAPLRAAAAAAVSAAALLLLWLALRLGPHDAAHGGAQESSTVGKTVSGVGCILQMNAAHLAHSLSQLKPCGRACMGEVACKHHSLLDAALMHNFCL